MSFEKLCFKIYCESGFFVNCNLPLQNSFLPTDSLIFHSHIRETRWTYQVDSLEPIQVFASGLEIYWMGSQSKDPTYKHNYKNRGK